MQGAATFLEDFFNEGSFMEIAIKTVDGMSKTYHSTVASACETAQQHARDPQTEIYFCVSPLVRRRRLEEDVLHAQAIWADIDGDKETNLARIYRFPLPPSYIVDSGNGYHAYWLLDKPTKDWELHRDACKIVQKILQGDAVHDRTRILRVPGTVNNKDPNNPKAVLLLENSRQRRYVLEDFAAVTSLTNEKVLHKIWTGDSRGYNSRSERDWAVITHLVARGLSNRAVKAIFDTFPIGDRARDDQRYFEHSLRKAREEADVDLDISTILRGSAADVVPSRSGGPEPEFIEGNNDCYYRRRKKGGGLEKVSTFVFEPKLLLKHSGDGQPDVLRGDVRARGEFIWKDIDFTRHAFQNINSLQRQMPVAAWQWLGSDREVRLLLPHLMDQLHDIGLPHARATGQLGRHGDLWVGSSVTFSENEVWEVHEAPLVWHDRHKRKESFEYTFGLDPALKLSIASLLPYINTPGTIWPIIGWFMATPYKTELAKVGTRFPILNLYGTRGSGKTSVIVKVLMPLLGAIRPIGRDCRTTRFVMLSLLGSSTTVPVFFTEFRRSSLSRRAAQEFLRCLLISYDSGEDARGNADQTITNYPLSTPFVVDGEDMIADPAAKERMVAINMHPEDIREGSLCYENFQVITQLPLRKFAGDYVRHCLGQDALVLWETAHAYVRKAFPQSLPDRVRSNLTTSLMGILSFRSFVDLPLPDDPIPFVIGALEASLESVVENITGRTVLAVDDFITDVVNEVAMGNASRYFIYKYVDGSNVLRVHMSTALNWWYMKRRRQGNETLEAAAVKSQLKERIGVEPGDYMQPAKACHIAGGAKWCWGIDIEKAFEAGLDVPQKLQSESEITFSIATEE